MPSRMSCSLTTTSASPNSSISTRRISAPGADHVDPARVHDRHRRAARRGWRRAGPPVTARTSPTGDPRAVDGVGVVGGQLQRERRHRRDRAGQPDQAGRLAHRHLGAHVGQGGPDVGLGPRATSSAVGGSPCRCRSVSRTQPMSTERAARTPSASPSTNSVEPAADVDHQERRPGRRRAVGRGGRVERGGRAEEGQLGLLVAGDDVGQLAQGRRHHVLEVGAVGGVAGGAGGHHPDRRRRRGRGPGAAYSASTRRVRSMASGASRPVASTPWPSRTTSIRRSRSVCAPSAGTSATSRRIELVPQSIAATRRHAALARRLRARAGRPPLPHLGDRAVADRVDARARRPARARPARAGT